MKRPNTKHVWHKCDDEDCLVCKAGFAQCDVCKAAEGELTKECPGHALPYETSHNVFRRRLDFVAGEWVRMASNIAQTKLDDAVTVSTAYVPRQVQGINVDAFETIIFNEYTIEKMYFYNSEESAVKGHHNIVAGLQNVGCAICHKPLEFNILDDRLDAFLRPWCTPCTEKHDAMDPDDITPLGQEVSV